MASNSFEAVGVLRHIGETVQVKDTFRKREFVLEIEDGNYPQHIKFQVSQDRCELLDQYKLGDTVRALFNLRGKPYQNKEGQTAYFTNLEAWRIESVAAASQPASTGERDLTGTFDDNVPF